MENNKISCPYCGKEFILSKALLTQNKCKGIDKAKCPAGIKSPSKQRGMKASEKKDPQEIKWGNYLW